MNTFCTIVLFHNLLSFTVPLSYCIQGVANCDFNRTHPFNTHTHPFNGPFSRTTRVGRHQKGKTNLDFTEARDSEWQRHQLGICKSAPRSRQTTTSAPHHSVFLQAGCPSCPVVKVRGLGGAQPPLLRLWRSLAPPLLESEPSLPTAGPKLLNSIQKSQCAL